MRALQLNGLSRGFSWLRIQGLEDLSRSASDGMVLTFLGTRGNIEPRKRGHIMHTVTTVAESGKRIAFDCGESWRGQLHRIAAEAIVVTHAHPDHVGALVDGAPCPVYATRDSWIVMRNFGIARALRRTIEPHRTFRFGSLRLVAFPVVHSERAPAVGFRIEGQRTCIFYVPDVLAILDRADALRDVAVYVGDGACLVRPIVRRSRATGAWIGHASIAEQLDWCRIEHVPRMIVTHCGSQIVGRDERAVGARIRRMGRERGVHVEVARDGARRILP
jgi:phosphoribosyl 1,2-cyclic phosphodiesterase